MFLSEGSANCNDKQIILVLRDICFLDVWHHYHHLHHHIGMMGFKKITVIMKVHGLKIT